jgi:hypothetical protein
MDNPKRGGRPPLVIVESPFAGDVERNIEYARDAMRDCFLRGEYPYASHLLYTQPGILDDDVPGERALGIEAGLVWGENAEKTVVYTDLCEDGKLSSGMRAGVARAEAAGRPVEFRTLPGWDEKRRLWAERRAAEAAEAAAAGLRRGP